MYVEMRILDERLHGFPPDYATDEAAAIDLRVCSLAAFEQPLLNGDVWDVRPGDRVKVGTGIALDLGSHEHSMHYAGIVLPRSGLGSKGIILSNSVGLIDADYTGEIFVSIWNTSKEVFQLRAMERIAQLVIIPIVRISPHVVHAFSRQTERGDGGFGSTGTK